MSHTEQIEQFEMKLGASGLRELIYCIQSGQNFHALTKTFGVSLYDLRYLRTVSDVVNCHLYRAVKLRLLNVA